ncbi:MAG TPA: hypothetical protein VF244_05515 [Acidimicrobiales bacterium]
MVDFGVAVNQVAAHRIAMGTRGYVAPELVSDARPTPAADVYGLAATAYALLTGRTPTADEAEAEAGGSAWLDREVARALRGGLSTDPVRRPGSATELVVGLEAASPGSARAGILTFLAVEPLPAGAAATIERHGGVVGRGDGPAVVGVFARASDAIAAALALQDAADDDLDDGPPALRMAVHTGEAERHQDGYRGGAVERVVAMCARAADGQILVSQVTRQLARDSLVEGVSLDPVGVRPGGRPRMERVFELSRSTGSEPSYDSSGSVTIPFDPPATAALAARVYPAPLRRRRGHTRTVVTGLCALALVVGGLAWAVASRDRSGNGGDVASGGTTSTTVPGTGEVVVVPLPPGTAPIPPGRYQTTTFAPAVTFTSDGTWQSLKGEQGDVLDLVRTSGPDTSLLTFVRVGTVFDAALAPATVDQMDRAASAAPDDVAAWLAAHPRLETTTEAVVVGGREAVRLQVRVRPGAAYPGARCPSRCVLLFALDTPGRVFELVEGNQNRLDVLTVDGATLVVATEAPPDDFDGFGAAVDGLMATLTA